MCLVKWCRLYPSRGSGPSLSRGLHVQRGSRLSFQPVAACWQRRDARPAALSVLCYPYFVTRAASTGFGDCAGRGAIL